MGAVSLEPVGDLDGQLAGRRKYQSARATVTAVGVPAICSIGSANAAVLPVPVWAIPRMSRPWSRTGMARAWIGVGV